MRLRTPLPIRHLAHVCAAALTAIFTLAGALTDPYVGSAPPRSRAESTNFEETSRYDDVIGFINRLQALRPELRVETFGRSHEGRKLPLMILSDPPVYSARQAADSGKTIVFIMATIHGGEVEGKEASLHFARRVLTGDLGRLLRRTVILIAPIYNADGNERISMENRSAQNGPIGGVGIRENAQGLDLNRDYMKAEAPETRALLDLFNRWDPHITVDLHTTNGSYHGYHLTYSVPLNPSNDPNILAYHRQKLMSVIQKAVKERHAFRTYYYGNFSGQGSDRTWRAFIPQPRAGQNYVGFRNRLTVLTEAYSYLDFKKRILVTEAMLEEICAYAAGKTDEIRKLTRRADEDAIRRNSTEPATHIGLEYQLMALPKPVEILEGEVTKILNPRSGREMTAVVQGKITPALMQDYGIYSMLRTAAIPRAYLIPRSEAFEPIVKQLRLHGIAVEELSEPLRAEADRFDIEEIARAPRPFQGHRMIRLKGRFHSKEESFSAGTWLIRTAQPLGTLAAYLLEPESDDGLAAWNFLDSVIESGKPYPVALLRQAAPVAARRIDPPEE